MLVTGRSLCHRLCWVTRHCCQGEVWAITAKPAFLQRATFSKKMDVELGCCHMAGHPCHYPLVYTGIPLQDSEGGWT